MAQRERNEFGQSIHPLAKTTEMPERIMEIYNRNKLDPQDIAMVLRDRGYSVSVATIINTVRRETHELTYGAK